MIVKKNGCLGFIFQISQPYLLSWVWNSSLMITTAVVVLGGNEVLGINTPSGQRYVGLIRVFANIILVNLV